MPLTLAKNTGIHENKTNTEFLFNVIYNPRYTNHTKLYAVSDTTLVYVEW